MLNIIYIISILITCYFAKVEVVVPSDYVGGKPVTWYVYFRNPNNMLTRSLTEYPNYDVGDWLQVCDNKLMWGERYFTRLPLIIK